MNAIWFLSLFPGPVPLLLADDLRNPITMRYDPDHKQNTHTAIVRDASQRFRSDGVAAPGVASLMRDAGLTHGGFYKHFASREDLLAQSLVEAFRDWTARLIKTADQAPPGTAWKVLIKEYLG